MTTIKKMKTALNYINKNTHDNLNHVYCDGDKLHTYDLETSVTVLNSFGLDKGSYKLKTIEHGLKSDKDLYHFSPAPSLATCKTTLNVSDLEDILQHASKDCTRLYLNGVYFHDNVAVATDGHTLKRIELNGNLESGYILPSTSIKTLLKLCKAFKVSEITIGFNDDFASVECSDFRLSSRLIQREYPRYQNAIPSKFETTLKIDVTFKDYKSLEGRAIIEVSNGEVMLKFSKSTEFVKIIGKCDVLTELRVSFDIDYLIRAQRKDREIEIKINNDMSPCEINGAIVMPVRL